MEQITLESIAAARESLGVARDNGYTLTDKAAQGVATIAVKAYQANKRALQLAREIHPTLVANRQAHCEASQIRGQIRVEAFVRQSQARSVALQEELALLRAALGA